LAVVGDEYLKLRWDKDGWPACPTTFFKDNEGQGAAEEILLARYFTALASAADQHQLAHVRVTCIGFTIASDGAPCSLGVGVQELDLFLT